MSSTPSSSDILDGKLQLQKTSQDSSTTKKPTCLGREVSLCNCISKRTLYSITTIFGTLLLIAGVLALAGHFAPASGNGLVTFLQQVNSVATIVATKLGSDLFTLSVFTAAFGTAFTLTGGVGLFVEYHQQTAVKN